jgi:hypothetical protein
MHYRNGIYAKFNIENVMSVADRAWFYTNPMNFILVSMPELCQQVFFSIS